MDFMTENHLTAALPNSKLPNPATITNGWSGGMWCKTTGVIRYADNTVAYNVQTPGLVFYYCLDNSSLNGYWQFFNVTELGANQAFDYRQSVLDNLNTPPGAPTNGDRYIVGPAPTGLWTGQANSIAQWDSTLIAWVFDVPVNGWLTLDLSAGPAFYYFDGFTWQPLPFGAGLINADNGLNVVGTTAKLGGLLLQNTTVNGASTFDMLFLNTKNFVASSTTLFELAVLSGPTGPFISATAITNKLQFRTFNSTGVAGDVLQSDGLGNAVWGPTPALPGLTAAINGLYTAVSTVKLGGPLIENTTVTATGFQFRLGDNFAVLGAVGAQDVLLSTAQRLWLNSDLQIKIRTFGSLGAANNLLSHDGIGAVWNTLAGLLFTANPLTATYPLQWDVPSTNIRVIPSATAYDVLTTNGAGLVVWSSFSSNPIFNSTVNSLISTYINAPAFFTTNVSFSTQLNTYLNTQINVFNVNILAPGNNQDVLTTQGTTVTWVTPAMATPLASLTNFVTISAGPVTRNFDIFAHPGATDLFIKSTGADTYAWVTGASIITSSMSANNTGVAGVGVVQPFVEIYESASLPSMRFRRMQSPNYALEFQYVGVNPTQSINIRNAIAPALPPSGPGDKILKWNSVTLLYEWASGASLVCADNGLSVNGITGCVELGGTVYKNTVVNSLYKGIDWTNFNFVRFTNFTATTLFHFFSVSSPLAISSYHNLQMSPVLTFLEMSNTYSLVGRGYCYMLQQVAGNVGGDSSFSFFGTDDKTGVDSFGNAGRVDIHAGLCINFTGRQVLGNNIYVDPTYNTLSAVVSQRETYVRRSVSCTLPGFVGGRLDIGQIHIVQNILPAGVITVTAGATPHIIPAMKSAIFICVNIFPVTWDICGPF
jgi:hypothetical protein